MKKTRAPPSPSRPERIRVNTLCPGLIAGDRCERVIALTARESGADPDDVRAKWRSQNMMRSFVDAADVAATVGFLLGIGVRGGYLPTGMACVRAAILIHARHLDRRLASCSVTTRASSPTRTSASTPARRRSTTSTTTSRSCPRADPDRRAARARAGPGAGGGDPAAFLLLFRHADRYYSLPAGALVLSPTHSPLFPFCIASSFAHC